MSSLRDFKSYLSPCFYQYARAYGTFLTSQRFDIGKNKYNAYIQSPVGA